MLGQKVNGDNCNNFRRGSEFDRNQKNEVTFWLLFVFPNDEIVVISACFKFECKISDIILIVSTKKVRIAPQ